MDEFDLLRSGAVDPGQPARKVAEHHRRQLRSAISAAGPPRLADDGAVSARFDRDPIELKLDVPTHRRARRGARRPVLFPLVVTAALALTAGAVVAIMRGIGADNESASHTTRVVTDHDLFGGEHSNQADARGAPLFLAPGVVPQGFELLEATGTGHQEEVGGIGSGPVEVDRIQRWVHLDATGERPVEFLDISWGPGLSAIDPRNPTVSVPSEARPEDPLDPYRRDSVPLTVRGREGLYSENGALVWEEPKGQVVTVSATTAPKSLRNPTTAPLPRELVQETAENLTPRRDGGFDLPEAPEDFKLAGEWPGMGWDGTNERVLVYKDLYDRGFRLQLVDDTARPPGMSLAFEDTRLVDVRGRAAVIGPYLHSAVVSSGPRTLFLLGANLHVQWLEPDGTRVTINGVGLTEAEILEIARGLEPVEEQTWRSLQDPGAAETVPLPEPTGPPPADAEAARQAVSETFVAANSSDTPLDRRIALLDDPTGVRDAYRDAEYFQGQALTNYTVQVNEVRFLGPTEAVVRYDLVVPTTALGAFTDRTGRVLLVDGEWKVSRDTVCGILGLAQATCRP